MLVHLRILLFFTVYCVHGRRVPISLLQTAFNHDVYPAENDPRFGQLWMDAFFFPDPSAGQPIFDAAATWCLNQTRVAVIGFGVSEGGYSCLFDFGAGRKYTTTAEVYPSACHWRQSHTAFDHLLTCDIPRTWISSLKGHLSTPLRVKLTNGLIGSGWHPIQPGWGNGLSASTEKPLTKYRIAATHMFKNSGARIISWLEWHIARGVEHFFLYDNNSEESDKQYTLSYEKKGIVTRISWPYCCKGVDNNHGQRGAMNHALYKFGQVADWMVFLDADEFIASAGRNIQNLLARVSPDVHIVGMQSVIMQPGCNASHAHTDQFLGHVPIAVNCVPQITSTTYPGKYFVRTLGAYLKGYVASTPHPQQIADNVTYKEFNELPMHVSHFREDFVNKRTESVLAHDNPLVQRFKLDWAKLPLRR